MKNKNIEHDIIVRWGLTQFFKYNFLFFIHTRYNIILGITITTC